MYIDSVVLENFQCFGPGRSVINLEADLTAFVGANGSGKTAVCQALLRLFGVSADDRAVRPEDFHVQADETTAPESRRLTIEVILAFPELGDDGLDGKDAVPEFFHRMAANQDGVLKCRIVLEATWEADGSLEGAVSDRRRAVLTFNDSYTDDECMPFTNAERGRIQMIYVPASRDGARQVTAFLRGRLWRAAQWSSELRKLVTDASADLTKRFHREPATKVVETALGARWQQLHDAGTHATPRFRPLEGDLTQLLRNTELVFEPNHNGRSRAARQLSDGQRSLLHLALTATALDIEAEVAAGTHPTEFDLATSKLPSLTLVAVEEPENSLVPFFLSRIVAQIRQLCQGPRAQAVISSHSPSVLTRIDPDDIRYFRIDAKTETAVVRTITLPSDGSEAAKYVREAVRAHPELYFARFVVLGEGDSEQLVIPKVAQAQGVELDPSFVAMVPLGGRHTNHFWRLLTDLGIPHATLLDLDFGRDGGGAGRLRDACNRLNAFGIDPLAGLDGYESVGKLSDALTLDQVREVAAHLQGFGVFFTDPLDLDYAMLCKFWDAYTRLDDGAQGPRDTDPIDAVLGISGKNNSYWNADSPTPQHQRRYQRLRWYRYLFLTRSKPSTHLRALAQLTDDQLREGPESISDLIKFIRRELAL